MQKYIIGIIIILAIVVLFFYPSFSSQNIDTPAVVSSVVTVVEPTYDFGQIDILAGKVSTFFTLKNEGTENVTIASAFTSCMCTEGEIDGFTFGMNKLTGADIVIPAGGEKTLKATYDPLAHGPNGVGKIKRELTLETNSSVTPEIEVFFTADVIKN